jgi:alkylation response protein AidB-like acyl-CoA dehydrogenase
MRRTLWEPEHDEFARIARIYGGTTEIMKEVVSRDLGLRAR